MSSWDWDTSSSTRSHNPHTHAHTHTYTYILKTSTLTAFVYTDHGTRFHTCVWWVVVDVQKPALRGEFSVLRLKQSRLLRVTEPEAYPDPFPPASEDLQDSDSDNGTTGKTTTASKGLHCGRVMVVSCLLLSLWNEVYTVFCFKFQGIFLSGHLFNQGTISFPVLHRQCV